jgi:hypothetical protein
MSDLVDEIKKLESKAQSFEEAVERIVALRDDAESVRAGEMNVNYFLSQVEQLIAFYSLSSKGHRAQVDAKGFHEAELSKYKGTTLNGVNIERVYAHKNREVFVKLKGRDDLVFVGMMEDSEVCYQSADYILCNLKTPLTGIDILK